LGGTSNDKKEKKNTKKKGKEECVKSEKFLNSYSTLLL
jgi:hypothetical protein